jgi:hypothetical protein
MYQDVFLRDEEDHVWFLFTYGDTWWHLPNLAREVSRIEESVAPASPASDFLVVGGGGYLIYSCFMIMSKPALRYLNGTTLDQCRRDLLQCSPYEHRMPNEFAQQFAVGCHHKGPGTGRASQSYTATALVNYCAAASLATGKCGPNSVGCEWRFGRLVRDPADTSKTNEMARRRFKQNHKRSRIRLGEKELSMGLSPECAPVMCSLVGFEHADNFTVAWLDRMVEKQALEACCGVEKPAKLA